MIPLEYYLDMILFTKFMSRFDGSLWNSVRAFFFFSPFLPAKEHADYFCFFRIANEVLPAISMVQSIMSK